MFLRHIQPGSIEWQDAVGWETRRLAGEASADDEGDDEPMAATPSEPTALFAQAVRVMAALHPA